jgi:hypothetical protein
MKVSVPIKYDSYNTYQHNELVLSECGEEHVTVYVLGGDGPSGRREVVVNKTELLKAVKAINDEL